MGPAASREHPRLTSIAPPIRPSLFYFKVRATRRSPRAPPGKPPEVAAIPVFFANGPAIVQTIAYRS